MSEALKAGDVVRLKSARFDDADSINPAMTIEMIIAASATLGTRETARVIWFDGDGDLRRTEILVAALELVEEESK